jgi:hypothetical protein
MQTVVFWCRHAAWQFPTRDIFSALKQELMLAKEDGNCTYLNQLDGRNLLVVSVLQISEKQLLYSPWHVQTTGKMQYLQMHLLA